MARLAAAPPFVFALCIPVPLHAQADDDGLRPGDQITTGVYTAGGEALASVQGDRLVDREGNVFFPYVGTVRVEGLDAAEIRALLLREFEPFYKDPVITVNVKLKVNITGVVGAPGHYFLDPTTTVVDALSTAGGMGSEVTISGNAAANAANVRLVRDGQTMILDLRPEIADPTAINMRVQSGDWIHVPPQQRSRFRDDIQFWGSVISLFTSTVAAIFIISGR